MDKRPGNNRWGWLPQYMPGVAAAMARKRAEFGNEHVRCAGGVG